jgi:hypothetical protein
MPGGEVVPIPETVSATCAATGPQPNPIARIDAISARRIVVAPEALLNCDAGFKASGS